MYLNPDTTAILVADRRSARELAARRHRSLATAFRRTPARPGARVPLAVSTGRTPVGAVCQAA